MKNTQTSFSRRSFLNKLSLAGAAIVLRPFDSWAIYEIDPKVMEIVNSTIGIDTHNHIDVPLLKDEVPGPNVDLKGEFKKSGLSAICMTFAVDYQKLIHPGDAYNRFFNGLDSMDYILKQNNIQRSFTKKDVLQYKKEKKYTVIQSVEGAHFLEGKIDRLGLAYDRGLRHLGLLHDNDASVPLGDVYTNPVRWGGLTSFGADTIRECNRLGILVDLAHANNETINAALKIVQHPVLISHTGLDTQLGNNPNMAKMMRPRLISKEQAKIVAEAGGAIGVWTHLADTPLEYAQNVKVMVDTIGIDHVCIGTDTKLTPPYRSKNDFDPHKGGFKNDKKDSLHKQNPNFPPQDKKQSNPNQQRVGERTNLAWKDQKDGFYYVVVDALLKTGFTKEDIAKIGGGNYLRLFNAATGA